MQVDLSTVFRAAREHLRLRPPVPLPPRESNWGWIRAALAFQQARPQASDEPAPDDDALRYLGRLQARIGARFGDPAFRRFKGSRDHDDRSFHYGLFLLAIGELEDAIKVFSSVVRAEPDHAAALAARAAAYRMDGKDRLAIADASRASALQPDLAWAYATRGAIHRHRKNYPDSLADLNKAIELQPDYEWCIAGRGETLRLMGRTEEALVDLHRSLELNPRNDWTIQCLHAAYMDLQEERTANRVLREGGNAFLDGDPLLRMRLPALTYRAMGKDLTRPFDDPLSYTPPSRAAAQYRRWSWLRPQG